MSLDARPRRLQRAGSACAQCLLQNPREWALVNNILALAIANIYRFFLFEILIYIFYHYTWSPVSFPIILQPRPERRSILRLYGDRVELLQDNTDEGTKYEHPKG